MSIYSRPSVPDVPNCFFAFLKRIQRGVRSRTGVVFSVYRSSSSIAVFADRLFQEIKLEILEFWLQIVVKPRLKDVLQLQRFNALKGRYSDVCNKFPNDLSGSRLETEGYDWSAWSANIRRSFCEGMQFDFLNHPTLAQTMVFARRRGIRATRQKLEFILEVYNVDVASCLLKEDCIGSPTITNAAYMTSANRCHHASHLAHYRREVGKDFWDCASIVEWGGGYGDMARVIRRINPTVTYTIIDLPELLALQYIYLASLEGEDKVHLVLPENALDILPGKINLVPSLRVIGSENHLKCDAFISTWALTESPRGAQGFVEACEFFGARNILLASMINANNFLSDVLPGKALIRIPVPQHVGLGPGNEYRLL